MVRMLHGHIGCSLCTSPNVSAVKDLEFTIASVSTRSVLSESLFRDLPCVCNKDISIARADTHVPLCATKQCRACMKESVSGLKVHSIWTALLDKHVNSALYLLSSFLPSFIRKVPNMSTPQFVKGG